MTSCHYYVNERTTALKGNNLFISGKEKSHTVFGSRFFNVMTMTLEKPLVGSFTVFKTNLTHLKSFRKSKSDDD